MNIILYALLAYALTIVISYAVTGIIVLVDKIMEKGES